MQSTPEFIPIAYRRYYVWAQIIIVFLFVELALWAPTTHIRNRWAAVSATTILLLTLMDRPSPSRLGLRFPTMTGAGVTLAIGCTAAISLLAVVHWMGGAIPASPAFPIHLPSIVGYLIWALLQEFILQSFFFTRFEQLYKGSTAVWMASSLFATAHLPNPILTVATMIGALFFCEMFRRYRSLYPIAIVHALLGLTVALTMPDTLLHHMRVGSGYLKY
jgi:membrane protease YdiL (CAAX protease family)